MSTERITEKLTKVILGMIADDNCGILPLGALLNNAPELETDDREQLYVNCKAASEVAMKLSQSFTRPVAISFEQRESLVDSDYVPDCQFVITWASHTR